MKSYVIDLECTYPGCDEKYCIDEINKLCIKCGRVLYARYDIEAVKKEFDSKLKTKSSNKEKKESPKKTEKKPTAKK